VKPLFVYGTLLFPEIVDKLIGEVEMKDAVLEHYRRVKVIDHGNSLPYPALIPFEGARTEGKLLHGLTEQQVSILDEYEGHEYERIEVEVQTATGPTAAWSFRWKNDNRAELGGEWDPEEFEREGLMAYLQAL
jgi:gamma-glutamylcyclotransferase (GGCT)/AIG2-like uncharacterized protein YtfP